MNRIGVWNNRDVIEAMERLRQTIRLNAARRFRCGVTADIHPNPCVQIELKGVELVSEVTTMTATPDVVAMRARTVDRAVVVAENALPLARGVCSPHRTDTVALTQRRPLSGVGPLDVVGHCAWRSASGRNWNIPT